jgi:enoyl-CoA hydratase
MEGAMPYKNISVEKSDRIAVVTINRPDKLNALSVETIDELRRAMLEIRHDNGVGAAILTGAGEKAFVAGADISELHPLDAAGAKQYAERGQHVLSLIEQMPKPVVAAVNGFALGGGCELAMACHMRIASEKARFGQPEVKLGVIPGFGGTQRLARLVGKGRAMELCLTGDMIDAQEAYRIGLVNKVTAPESLMEEAKKLLGKILAVGPRAAALAIEAIHKGLDMDLASGLLLEADLFGLSAATEDWKEGTKAFMEKRAANFKGK